MSVRMFSRNLSIVVSAAFGVLLATAAVAAACIVNKSDMTLTGPDGQSVTVAGNPGSDGTTFMEWCPTDMGAGYTAAKAAGGDVITIEVSPNTDECQESGDSSVATAGNGGNHLPEGEYLATWTEQSNANGNGAFVDDGDGGGTAADGAYHHDERDADCMAVPPTDAPNAAPMNRVNGSTVKQLTGTFKVDSTGNVVGPAPEYMIPNSASPSGTTADGENKAAGICITKIDQGPGYYQVPFAGGSAGTQTSAVGPPVGNIIPIEIQ